MERFGSYLRRNARLGLALLAAVIIVAALLFYKLGNLVPGLSKPEAQTAVAAVGWHGLYHQPFYLPLKLIRSVLFWLKPAHGPFITRLPNALLGSLTIAEFVLLVRYWHGRLIAALAGLLFATAAWTLHVSRLGSFDVAYLWVLPTILLVNTALAKFGDHLAVWYASLLGLLLILYVPGAIWLVIAELYFSRQLLVKSCLYFSHLWQRLTASLFSLVLLGFLAFDLSRSGQLKPWLGWPAHLAGIKLLIKDFIAVPVHILVRGPEYPNLWLARSPLLDIFTLATSLIGLYFYASHFKTARSQRLLAFLAIGWVLVALNGPVSLSLLVPLMYVLSATGLAYLLRQWLKTFPVNPLARSAGIALLSLLVAVAVFYNLRAYFVAWPHDPTTKTVFSYQR